MAKRKKKTAAKKTPRLASLDAAIQRERDRIKAESKQHVLNALKKQKGKAPKKAKKRKK